MSELLRRVRVLSRRRRRTTEEYRAALEEAHAAGHTQVEIARAAGVTQSTISEHLRKGKT